MKLATFDIFDTTLVRKCGQPGVVPHLVALRLWPDDDMGRCEFLNARRQAASGKGSDCTLVDIYAADGLCTLPDHSAEKIMHEEMAVEAEMLTANNLMVKRIRQLRSEDWTVKFLSDMYLPSAWLKEILMREGCAEADDEVIVSCEWGARKDDGSLYRKVRGLYAPTQWHHFGDNRYSDYKMARRNGVKATLVDSGYSDIEKQIIYDSLNLLNGWQLEMLAGMSRAYRLNSQNTPAEILAADFVAPLYISFVIDILRKSQVRKLKRLHFLSRDGYIMMRIAEVLADKNLELNYLFVSRRSLMRAYLVNDTENRYIAIADRKTLIARSVNHLLWQLQTSREELSSKFEVEFQYDKILSSEQEADFLKKMFHHPMLTPWLLKQFEKDAKLTEEYFAQEGLLEVLPQAMVDVGWLGTSRMMINGILNRRISKSPIPTFYVGVRHDVYSRIYGDFSSFFGDNQLDTNATALIENYFSASPYPSTISYKNYKNEILPQFPEGKEYTENEVLKANIAAVTTIAEWIMPIKDQLDMTLLFHWAKLSLDSISKLNYNIDLSPLMVTDEFDDGAMVKVLNPIQLISVVLLGGRQTAFDRGSIALTAGHKLSHPLWQIHKITERIRGFLYRKFILKTDK